MVGMTLSRLANTTSPCPPHQPILRDDLSVDAELAGRAEQLQIDVIVTGDGHDQRSRSSCACRPAARGRNGA